jgi:hypothetical protein
MPYPQITEYQEAVQHPQTAFADSELQGSRVEETPLGLPLALSGGFALTYPMITPRRKVAVRCFHRQIPSAEQRYDAIARKLKELNSPYFVNFDYWPMGIKVRGSPYPIVRMDWAQGETLNLFLDKRSGHAKVMEHLRASFRAMASFLDRAGIAHGDIQNLNVIVVGTDLRLIDYDGMYVPPLQIGNGTEVGHKHFQHPERSVKDFGPLMDRFSFIVVDVSLHALMVDPTLHARFREGGETIIFKANDYADPAGSEIFRILKSKPELRAAASNLERVCGASISQVPKLEEFLAGNGIPAAKVQAIRPTGSPEVKSTAKAYISAFDVFNTTDFSGVMRNVGNKIELVGRIEAVKHGVGRRGRGRGKPYVFINFGSWRGNIVKLTIWSEGLTNMSNAPSDAWVGRWVSVTGLVDPPYHGRHYGNEYTHVGITLTADGQVQFVTEADAQYRLGVGGKAFPPSNQSILQGIGVKPSAGPPKSAKSPVTPNVATGARSSNRDILNAIKKAPSVPTQTYAPTAQTYTPTVTQTPPLKGKWLGVPRWIWWVAGIVVLYIIFHNAGK